MQVEGSNSSDFDQKAMLKTLSDEMMSLLTDIAILVGEGTKGEMPMNDSDWRFRSLEYEVWDGSLFHDFVMCLTQKGLKKKLEEYFLQNNLPNSTFGKVRSAGLGFDNAIKGFCLSSHYQHRPLSDFIIDYVIFCESQNFYPKSFLKNKSIVNNILKEFGKSLLGDEQLSLQDTITLDDEVEKLKEILGFYPRKKDQIVVHDAETLINTEKKVHALLSTTPNNIDLLLLKAVIFKKQKKAVEALEITSELFAQNENDRAIRTAHAASLFDSNKVEEALSINLGTLELYADHPHVLACVAAFYSHSEEHENAIEYYKKSIVKDNEYLSPLLFLSKSYLKIDKVMEAEAVLRTGLQRFPNNEHLLLELYKIIQYRETDQKYDILMKLVKSGRIAFDVEYLSEFIEVRKNNFEGASELVENYLQHTNINPLSLDQEKASASILYGQYFLNELLKDRENVSFLNNSKECFRKAIEHDSKNHLPYELYSVTCLSLGEENDAQDALNTAYELLSEYKSPTYPNWQAYIAVYLHLLRLDIDNADNPLFWLLEKHHDDIDNFAENVFYSAHALLISNKSESINTGMLNGLIYSMAKMYGHLCSYPATLKRCEAYMHFLCEAMNWFDKEISEEKETWSVLSYEAAFCSMNMASIKKSKNDLKNTINIYEDAIEFSKSNDLEFNSIACKYNIGLCYFMLFLYDLEQTEEVINEAITLLLAVKADTKEQDSRYYEMESLYILASSYNFIGQLYDKSAYKNALMQLNEYQSLTAHADTPRRSEEINRMIEFAQSNLE